MPGETLRVSVGAAAGRELPVDPELVIGREAEKLGDDTEISRRHARIARGADGRLVIEDLGSTNGTIVNGVRIGAPQQLNPGDTIQLGATTLVVEGGSPVGQSPAPGPQSPAAGPPPPPGGFPPPPGQPQAPGFPPPGTGLPGPRPDRGDAGGGMVALAIILGIVGLLGGLFMVAFNYLGIDRQRCDDIDFSELDFGEECLDISETGLLVAQIAGWPSMILAFLVLPFAIRFAVKRDRARLWVVPLAAAVVLAAVAIGGAQLL